MIKHIIFDMDNTLYSSDWGLEKAAFQRIWEFASSLLNLPEEKAKPIWQDGYGRFGTTIGWLIAEKGFTDVDGYYAHVHPEFEADLLLPDPRLRPFLESLPCPCSILTNSIDFHAERIIEKLQLQGIFRRVFDIKSNNYQGKPNASAYLKVLDAFSLKPEEALFIDDNPLYVEGYSAIGGRGILFDEKDLFPDFPLDRIKNLFEITKFTGNYQC